MFGTPQHKGKTMDGQYLQQFRINERGELEPMTWDGEPLFSPVTISESSIQELFDAAAFAQLPGQLPFEDDDDGRS